VIGCCRRYIKGAPKSGNQDTEGTTLDCAPLHAFHPVKAVAARDAMLINARAVGSRLLAVRGIRLITVPGPCNISCDQAYRRCHAGPFSQRVMLTLGEKKVAFRKNFLDEDNLPEWCVY